MWKLICVEGWTVDGWDFSPGKKGRFLFREKNMGYTNEVVEVDVERIECLRII